MHAFSGIAKASNRLRVHVRTRLWVPLISIKLFFRAKPAGSYRYLQIIHNVCEGKKVRPQVLATLGPNDLLEISAQFERLTRSGLRHCENLAVIDAHAAGERRIGPDLVFGRLWKESGIPEVFRSGTK